jgi:hypothetical protein
MIKEGVRDWLMPRGLAPPTRRWTFDQLVWLEFPDMVVMMLREAGPSTRASSLRSFALRSG